MHNYRKLRLILKGQAGFQFTLLGFIPTTTGSVLGLNIIDQLNLYQSKIWLALQDELARQRQLLINNNYLTASNVTNILSLGLTNLGIMSGNSTIANLGLLGNSVNNGILLMLNWKGLSGADKTTGVAGIAGQAVDTLDNMFFSKQHANDSALTKGLNNTYDTVSNAAMMFSPVGTIVGGAMKVGKFLGDGLSAIGVGTDQMTKTDLVLDSNFMKLTPVGLVNGLGAKKTLDFSANNDTIEKVGGSYGGSVNTINDAVSKAGKKYGLFSGGARRKANRLIDSARLQLNTMTNISNEYQDQLANKSDLAYTRYNMDINGGYLQLYIRAAKLGAILNRILLRKHRTGGLIHEIINVDTKEIEWQPVINLDIKLETPEFKDGGELPNESTLEWQPSISIEPKVLTLAEGGKPKLEPEESKEETNQKNVIPEGALHANKHHMEHAEDLTKKGIPVIDNKGEQQAEIERNEIIFSLEVTKKLEELHEKYQGYTNTLKEKDEIAIEAGKLLVYEILHNTEDRTGLIKECKKGGTLDEHK